MSASLKQNKDRDQNPYHSARGSKVILELTSGNEVEVSFSKGSTKEGIIRKALCRVKRSVKMGIRKMDDPKTSITVEKFLNKRAKKLTLYVTVNTGKRLKLQEPGKKLLTAIVKVLDIVEGRETIVAVVGQSQVQCNKMQNIGKPDRLTCSMLGHLLAKSIVWKNASLQINSKKFWVKRR